MNNHIAVSGTVAIGVMHEQGGFTFDRDYYFDPNFRWQQDYRGRDNALVCVTPPSEPCVRFSRTRLSSRCYNLHED